MVKGPAAARERRRVALVAGGTRGAGRGVAVELGAIGATVYVTGRSSRERGASEMGRGETIEETAEQVTAAGGLGMAVRVDHLYPDEVASLVGRIGAEQGRLDVLVNSVWGGDHLTVFDTPLWEQPLEQGLRLLHLAVDSHLITNHCALPLLLEHQGGLVVELTDGTAAYHQDHYRGSMFFDLAKVAVNRLAFGLSHEVGSHGGTAVAVSPGWLRSEAMLDHFGVTEESWREALATDPHFGISESPHYVGRAVAALASDPDVARWNGASVSSTELARAYGVTDTDGSQPDAWRYITDVVEAGRPADPERYR